MSVESRLRELAERVQGMSGGFSERDTERYLVEPFMDALGYDSRNPAEVQAQLPVKIGSTTKNCDYAIHLHGEVRVLVECKKAGVALDNPGQLASYFSQVPTALLGIYTNGFEYRFYAERNLGRVKQMDDDPFLILNLRNLDQTAIGRAAKCGKEEFGDADGFQQWVNEIRYTRVVGDRLRRELTGQPSDELVNLAMDWAGVAEKTPERVEGFMVIVRDAARTLLNPTPEPISRIEVAPVPQPAPAQSVAQPSAPPDEGKWMPLSIVKPKEIDGSPTGISLPDGEISVNESWTDALEETARWLFRSGVLTRENCQVSMGPKRYLVNLDGMHKSGKPFVVPRQVGAGIVLEAHLDGNQAIRQALRLLEHFGQDPSQVYLKLS